MRGFTLVEFLISMGIIVVLSSVIILGKTSEEKKLALQRMAYQISQDFRQAQEKSMGAEEEKSICGVQLGYNRFGIHFNQGDNYYYLFVDCDGGNDYDNDEMLRKISLEREVKIENLTPLSPLDIVFEPPEPLTYINGAQWGAEAAITLKLESSTKKVKINSSGRIEIEQ